MDRASTKTSPSGAAHFNVPEWVSPGYADRSSLSVLPRVIPRAVVRTGVRELGETGSCGDPGVVSG